MASPEDRDRHRRRMKNKWAKELRTPKYRQKVREDKTRKVELKDLSHADLVRLMNEDKED